MLPDLGPFAGTLLAQSSISETLWSIWSVVLVLLGFSVVIYFHELGHFAAAKWAGVRVERFAIGFGRELVGFTRGETRYSFNLLPFGGYVKMLGQEDFAVDKSGELKVRDNPDSFTSKPVSKRMVIVSAGVVMNLLFAALAFTVVNMIGRYELPSVVGHVDPASAAGRAGIRTGDRIIGVNNEKIVSFEDLLNAVVLSDINEELELTIQRDNRILQPKPRVMPEYKADAKVRQIGLGPGMTRRVLVTAELDGCNAPHELRANDLLDKLVIDGQPREIRNVAEVWRALREARGLPVDLIVKRPTGQTPFEDLIDPEASVPSQEIRVQARAVWQLLPSEPADLGTCSLLGLVPRLVINEVDAKGPAALAGARRGDVIVSADKLAAPSFDEFKRIVRSRDDQDFEIIVRRPCEANGRLSASAVSWLVAQREALIRLATTDPAAARQHLGEAAAVLGDEEPRSLQAAAGRLTTADAWQAWLDGVDRHRLIVRPRSTRSLFGRRSPTTAGLTPHPWEDDQVVVASVVDNIGGALSPARAAGIPAGAIIVEAAGQPVTRWSQLTELFRANAGSAVPVTYRLGTSFSTASLSVPHDITTLAKLPPEAQIIAIDGQTQSRIDAGEGLERTAVLPDWQAVAGILKSRAGRTVPVKYRTADGAEHETAVAVSADAVDPWVLRVAYSDGRAFACWVLREFMREPNPLKAMRLGFDRSYDVTVRTYLTIKHIVFTRNVGVEKISGPVGIFRTGSQIAEAGLTDLLWFLGLISVNLAVINFLPLPIVDGGLFVFLLLEKVRGEPVSIKMQVATQIIGLVLIVSLFLFVTFQDIANW